MTIIKNRLPIRSAIHKRDLKDNVFTLPIKELQNFIDDYASFVNLRVVTLEFPASMFDVTTNPEVSHFIFNNQNNVDPSHGVELPLANASEHKRYVIKNSVVSLRDINVFPTIDGMASVLLSPGDSMEVVTDGTNWHII